MKINRVTRGLLLTGLLLAWGLTLEAADPALVTKDADDKFETYLRRIESAYTNDLQAGGQARQEELRQKKNRDILELARKYDAVLAEREAKLTAAGNQAGVLAVKEARERAMLHPAVTAAEFEMAVSEPSPTADAAPAAEVPVAEAAAEAESDATSDTAPVADPAPPVEERSAGVLVFEPGKKPPPQEASAIKKLTLARSENAPLGSPVVVVASCTTDSDTKREEIGHFRREDVVDRWRLRLHLRTAPAAGALDSVLVVVQNFIKNAQAQGRVEPEAYMVSRVPLRRLAPEVTTVDFPPVETRMMRQRQALGATWQVQGKEFYGVIISVFDANRALIYQGSSIRGLNSEAGTGVPELALPERLEEARLAMVQANEALNAARIAFFANQRDEANREAFVEATRVYEESQRTYNSLKVLSDAQRVPGF